MKKLLLIALLTVCSWADTAKPSGPSYKNTNTIGFSTGFVSGVGFTWKHWYDVNGFQLTLLPYVDWQKTDKIVYVDAAANYLHALWQSPTYTFRGYASRNLVYSYTGTHVIVDRETMPGYYDNSLYTSVGTGLGLQMNTGAIQFNMGIGLAGARYDTDYQDSSSYWFDKSNNLTYSVYPVVDLTLGYTFHWD